MNAGTVTRSVSQIVVPRLPQSGLSLVSMTEMFAANVALAVQISRAQRLIQNIFGCFIWIYLNR